MWNSRKYAAMAFACAGLAVAAATPASAWWPTYGGYYEAPYGYGTYGYSGAYDSVSWPYPADGYTDDLSYGYSGRGVYDSVGWGGCGSGYRDGYGLAYGYAGYRRPWGAAYGLGWAAYHPRGVNGAVAYRRTAGSTVAAERLRRTYDVAVSAPRPMKPASPNKVTYRIQNPKLAHNGQGAFRSF
jgi:hypothetical protein